MSRRDELTFRQEMKFRNKLVEYLTDWIMGNLHRMNIHADASHLTRELDQASMEAVAALLAGEAFICSNPFSSPGIICKFHALVFIAI